MFAFALVASASAPAFATLAEAGPPVFVYKIGLNGQATLSSNVAEPSLFNVMSGVLGVATPPASALLSSSSTFGGSLSVNTNLTASTTQLLGTVLLTCTATDFKLTNSPECVAAAGSVSGSVNEFVAAQSWPFYVDSGTSSNIPSGAFVFETTSDDGSWFVLAPAPFTYAQPANFQNATGLTAGSAVVNNGNAESSPASVQGSAFISAAASGGSCASNLYWLTWEYFEIQGGAASIEYSWEFPGAEARTAVTQGVVYGQVTKSGTATSGESVSVSVNGGTATTLKTDVNGCYGFNAASSTAAQSVSVTATDTASGQTQTQIVSLSSGNSIVQNFAFPNGPPDVSLYKRITKVVTAGATVVPTPDPSNPTGVLGTANYSAGVQSGSVITYTIYFANTGTLQAQGTTAAVGPSFSDSIPANTTLVAGSESFTCCTNPTATTSATLTAGSAVVYAMAAPLAPLSTPGGVEGNFAFSVTVK